MGHTYTPTIGLEVHAELKTQSKMFCGCKNDPHHAEPNVHICPVCMGHPGTLPTVNKQAVQQVLIVGNALKGSLASYSEFDRKNYFYPDIPKGYQISQYAYPFVSGGTLAGVEITRVHLEEDTARSQHDQGDESLIDFNRAGVPLMELVTEPVIHDHELAGRFARELQLLLRTLGVSDANMEKGEMRVEANISVSKDDTFGTKVEVKNLNSFKAVESAIKFEIKRQVEVLEKGGQIVQETRGWNENTSKTFSQRKKESSHDYRYFPDPDIPKLDTAKEQDLQKTRIDEITPELPDEKRSRYSNLGIKSNQIEVIIGSIEIASLVDAVFEKLGSSTKKIQLAANYITSDILGHIAADETKKLADVSIEQFSTLIELVEEGLITSRVAKDLLLEVAFQGVNPKTLAEERGLMQSNSEDDLIPVVEKILAQNEAVAAEYKSGKEAALQFLIGQGMKESKGSANPALLVKLFTERL